MITIRVVVSIVSDYTKAAPQGLNVCGAKFASDVAWHWGG